MYSNARINNYFSLHALYPRFSDFLTDGSCCLSSQRAQDLEGFACRRRLREVSAKNGLWLQRCQGRHWHIPLAQEACYMLETSRENGKVSPGILRKPYPPGLPAWLAIFLLPGEFSAFCLSLVERGKAPKRWGICWPLSWRMSFSACSEKLMPLCSTQGGTAGSSLCPAVGIISDGGMGHLSVRFSPSGSPVLQLSPRREGSLCQQPWREAANQAAIAPAATAWQWGKRLGGP